jgi:hypothetical protein
MRAAFHASIVNGTFINLHSVKDYVLSKVFTMIHPGQVPDRKVVGLASSSSGHTIAGGKITYVAS